MTDSAMATDYIENAAAKLSAQLSRRRATSSTEDANGLFFRRDTFGMMPSRTAKHFVITANTLLRTNVGKTHHTKAIRATSMFTAKCLMARMTSRFGASPTLKPCGLYLVTNTVGFDLGIPDVFRAAHSANEVKHFEETGDYPNLSIIWLSSDHTWAALHRVPPSPRRKWRTTIWLSDESLENQPQQFWKDTCVFCIEDDPQVRLASRAVIARRLTSRAYIKRGQVVHTQYNHTSLLRTIELILGLPPMNQMDATATPMFDCFTDAPDVTCSTPLRITFRWDQINPAPKKISDPLLRKDAYVPARLP